MPASGETLKILTKRAPLVIALGMLTACAAVPPAPSHVLTMQAGVLPPQPGLPPAGTTWRLDESELRTLSPAPYVPPPPLMLPYPVPGAAPPPPAYVPYAYIPPPPLFYFGLGYSWGGHRHWSGRRHGFHSRGQRSGRR